MFSWLIRWADCDFGSAAKAIFTCQHKEFHICHQIPPKKNSAFPSSPGLLLWLARSPLSVHAPGHSSVGLKGGLNPHMRLPCLIFLMLRKISQGDVWGFWPLSSGNPVLVHAQISALVHRRYTGGHRTWHRGSMKGMCIEPSHPDCTAQRCRLLGDPRKKYFRVCCSWSSQGRLGHQFECQAQHPFPLASPAGGRKADSHVGCSALRHQTSFYIRSKDKKYVMRIRDSSKPGLFLLPFSAHQPGSFINVCGDISYPQWRQKGMEWAEG